MRRERHHHHLPRDAEAELRASGLFKEVPYGAEVTVAKGITARLVDAGHILGSSIIVVRAAGQTLVFSGDLGRRSSPIIRDPTILTDADYVLLESTYGGREHEPEAAAVALLAETVNAVDDAGGPKMVFVVHGDPAAEHALEPKIRGLGFNTKIPSWQERVTLD